MPFPTVPVLNATGGTVTVNTLPNAGQQAMAESLPVTIANNQSAITVSGTFWQATQPVSIAATVAVSQSGAWNIGSITTLPSLPAGANVIGGVTQSGTWNVTNISGTVSLPTGAATSANQSTLNTSIGATTDAAAANGAAGTLLAYARAIKDAATDPSSASLVTEAVDVFPFTPTLDTSIYAAGDVLSATAALTNIMRVNDGRAHLMSLTGVDKTKQKPAMTILFYQTNVTSAAANAANNLSDADQLTLLGYKRILAADWIDWANNSTCCFTSINLLLEAVSGTRDVYVVTILDAGTPTFAVGDLGFKLGILQS